MAVVSCYHHCLMDDSLSKKIKVIPDHFEVSSPTNSNSDHSNIECTSTPPTKIPSRSHSHLWIRRKLRSASFVMNLFSLRGLPWSSSTNGQEKVEITAAELESLRSELAEMEERESHLKAQLENVDEILRSARLTGYLYIRTRWTALPGEPPPLDDNDVDDWIPRFVVLQGPCIFLYRLCTDLSPQDSSLLSDIVEVTPMPSFTREDGETRYVFKISTHHGLRYECSSSSKIQVDSWLSALQTDCTNLGGDPEVPSGASDL